MKITYTIFADLQAKAKQEKSAAWFAFAKSLAEPKEYPTRESCPLISLASYGDKVSGKGAVRNAKNVLKVYGIEGDYDGGEVSLEEAGNRLRHHGVEALLYTTARHTPEKPRWRVIAPLMQPCPPAERAMYVVRLNAALGNILAPESFVLSQGFYLPKVNGAKYLFEHVHGKPMDRLPQLATLVDHKPSPPDPEPPEDPDAELVEAIATGANFHNSTRTLAARWVAQGMSQSVILAALEGLMRKAEPRKNGAEHGHWRKRLKEIRGLVESAGAKYTPPKVEFPAGDDVDVPDVDDDDDVLRPEPMREDAYIGLAGRFVEMVEPQTEACREALLIQFLVGAGCAFGRAPYCQVGADRHGLNESVVLTGITAKGRKGSSLGFVERALVQADPPFESRVVSGLATGEGLIHLVRDPKSKIVTDKTGAMEVVEIDAGVTDKRLLATCEELALVLAQTARDGNTLSPRLREAWDGKRLTNALRDGGRGAEECREPHVSVIAHITRAELRATLTSISQVNGLANRFLFAYVHRAKELPGGGGMPGPKLWDPFIRDLQRSLAPRSGDQLILRDEEAQAMWVKHYSELSAEHLGLLGALLARWEAHALRLAAIYACLDGVRIVSGDHMHAAFAVLDYCKASTEYIFGTMTGDAMAERILEALRATPAGLTRAQIRSDVFQRNKTANAITDALELLERQLRIEVAKEQRAKGRPAIRYRLRKRSYGV